MRVLVLSCNTGEGHNSAAKAVCEEFDKLNIDYEMHNALLFVSKATDKTVSSGHTFIYKNLPKLFGVGYRFEENHPPEFIQNVLKLGVNKLYKFLENNHFDCVVASHVFGAILVNETKKAFNIKMPIYFIATDYTCCPGSFECNADTYFIPHKKLVDEFVSCGVDKSRLIASGIPVRSQFFESCGKSEAKKKLGLPEDKSVILLGGGSMGAGPIEKLSVKLADRLSNSHIIVVACGRNEKLLNSILKSEMANLMPIGYTKKIDVYLDACDIYLTKAGGLSTTEAIIKKTPLIYINAVPGCETRNIDFMTQNGYAKAAFTIDEAVNAVLLTLETLSDAKEKMAECKEGLASNPAEFIASFVKDNTEN